MTLKNDNNRLITGHRRLYIIFLDYPKYFLSTFHIQHRANMAGTPNLIYGVILVYSGCQTLILSPQAKPKVRNNSIVVKYTSIVCRNTPIKLQGLTPSTSLCALFFSVRSLQHHIFSVNFTLSLYLRHDHRVKLC